MRLDFHIHSLLSKNNGDSINMISFLDNFKIMKKYNVKACAYSDHNFFSADVFIKNKINGEKIGIKIYPAVELDVTRLNYIKGNVIIVFDNELSEQKLYELEAIINKQLGKRKLSVKNIDDICIDFEKIVIPHVGKSDYVDPDDLNEFAFDAIELTNWNHPNYKKFLKKSTSPFSIVAFSDTHIWKGYPQNKKLYTEINCDNNFQAIKNHLKNNENFVKER